MGAHPGRLARAVQGMDQPDTGRNGRSGPLNPDATGSAVDGQPQLPAAGNRKTVRACLGTGFPVARYPVAQHPGQSCLEPLGRRVPELHYLRPVGVRGGGPRRTGIGQPGRHATRRADRPQRGGLDCRRIGRPRRLGLGPVLGAGLGRPGPGRDDRIRQTGRLRRRGRTGGSQPAGVGRRRARRGSAGVVGRWLRRTQFRGNLRVDLGHRQHQDLGSPRIGDDSQVVTLAEALAEPGGGGVCLARRAAVCFQHRLGGGSWRLRVDGGAAGSVEGADCILGNCVSLGRPPNEDPIGSTIGHDLAAGRQDVDQRGLDFGGPGVLERVGLEIAGSGSKGTSSSRGVQYSPYGYCPAQQRHKTHKS